MNNLGPRKNGSQVAEENALKFQKWIEIRNGADDWRAYFRNGKLIKKEAYTECGFHRAVFESNPAIAKLLADLESRCAAGELFPITEDEKRSVEASQARPEDPPEVKDRIKSLLKSMTQKDARIKDLEEKLAAKRAEVQALQEQMSSLKMIENHLCDTGRMLRP